MALVIDFYNSSNSKSQEKVIPWNNKTDIDSKANWATGASDIYYTYQLIDNNEYNKRIKIQYGLNVSGWATNVFYDFLMNRIVITELDDGSYRVTGSLMLQMYAARQTDFVIGGVQVTSRGVLLGEELFNTTRLTSDEFTNSYVTKNQPFDVVVKPQESYKETGIQLTSVYPNGEFPNASITVGFQLKNTNVPQYKPMAIRKSGTWETLNISSGFIKIRKSGTYVNKSLENNATSKQQNKGKNRIRKNLKWLQLPKM